MNKMKHFIIVIHDTADGKWRHNPHTGYGVFRSYSTAMRKLKQLVVLGEIPGTGIGAGTIDESSEPLPYTARGDFEFPLPLKMLKETNS